MHVSPLVWWLTVGITTALLVIDVVVIGRRPHEPSRREVGVALAFFIGLAVAFGIGIFVLAGSRYGTEFFAGWLTEYSLSVDNLFIFLIIMTKFGVPRAYQQTALLIGIVLALLMRGIFIGVGAAAIENFSWVFYLFGVFLIYTAVKLARGGVGGDEEFEESALVRWVGRHLPATSAWHSRPLVGVDRRLMIPPMFIVVLALGTTDLLFALASIPAIYGLTSEPYLVMTANIFALMGLRQLYFLIGGLLERLVFLSYGLAVLLGFIGIKLVLHALHENALPFVNGGHPVRWAPDIPIWLSLLVIVGTLAVTTVVSLVVSRRRQAAERDPGTPAPAAGEAGVADPAIRGPLPGSP